MGNLLYKIAIVLLIIWSIGYWGFDVGGVLHVLLVIAVVVIILRLLKGDKV